jgi:hypothetical protein
LPKRKASVANHVKISGGAFLHVHGMAEQQTDHP